MKKSVGQVTLALMLSGTMIWTGCSTNWIGEGEEIVSALIPAATNTVALVAALQGKGVSQSDLQTIQSVGTQASADLQLIGSLITAYQKADASAQPGILNQIDTAISTVQGNLQALLPALHIQDAATQAKVTAVVGLVLSEVQSLAAIIPVIKGQSSGQKLSLAKLDKKRTPLSASEFVESFNRTLTAKTGNADLDRAAAGLKIHLHNKAERIVSAGLMK